jgi:hypothetical protein
MRRPSRFRDAHTKEEAPTPVPRHTPVRPLFGPACWSWLARAQQDVAAEARSSRPDHRTLSIGDRSISPGCTAKPTPPS